MAKLNRTQAEKLKNAALSYIKYGWAVMPLQHTSKQPLKRHDNDIVVDNYKDGLRHWSILFSGANIGLPIRANNISVLHFSRGANENGLNFVKKCMILT